MNSVKSRTRLTEMLNPETVRIQYLDNVIIGTEDVKKDYEIYDELTEKKRVKKLVVSGRFTNLTTEARKYVQSENSDRSGLIVAEALVMGSLPQRLAANAYFTIIKKVYPVKIFSSEKSAISWLNGFD